MKRLIPLFIAISISGLSEVTAAPADNMQSAKPEQIVYKLGTFKPYKGSEKVFTGDVRVDPWYPCATLAQASLSNLEHALIGTLIQSDRL